MDGNQSLPNVRVVTDEQPVVPPEQQGSKRTLVIISIAAFVVLVALVAFIWFLATTNLDTTSRFRDIFIIFMALEFLVVGVALIVLLIQLATLINLLQNEIKPILTSTNETVNTLRGTAAFLSDNLVEPVIKLNTYLAGLKKALDLFNLTRR